MTIWNTIKQIIERLVNKSHGENGCVFISGAQTISGSFCAISIGATKPDTLKITTSEKPYLLNTANLAATDDLINFVTEGQYLPINCTSITTTGSGYIIAWYK